jgi:hypothetical protein
MKSDSSVRAEASRLLADEWRARARVLRRSDSDPYAGDTADVIEEMAGELEARKLEGPDPETITRLREYAQHKAECQLSWAPVKKHPSPAFGRYYMKRTNGKIGHFWEHVCGAQGFGHPGDVCPGCDHETEDSDPVCTCGLSSLLAGLAASQEKKAPTREQEQP